MYFKAVRAELKATRPGAILSMDLSYWPTPSPGGAKHLLVLHDQFSTLIACAPLIRKSDASDVIQQFILTSETPFGLEIAVVHSDQGGVQELRIAIILHEAWDNDPLDRSIHSHAKWDR